MKKKIFFAMILVVVAGAALCGPIMSNVEQAKYTVVEKHDNIEIRQYEPMIVAETSVSADREASIKQGFRTIADYIFGNNTATQKISMTAPVIQQASNEKIAMTAPVLQTGTEKTWSIRFVMPSDYTMDTLPKPVNQNVKFQEIASKRYAVIRFSGIADSQSLKDYTAELESFMTTKQLKPISNPTYAFFNPPWTLPFLRRNEVMIEVAITAN